jgi:hypothetical protein
MTRAAQHEVQLNRKYKKQDKMDTTSTKLRMNEYINFV